jgi:hypothetical protein
VEIQSARWSTMDGFTHADLIGRNVYDRNGRVVGPIVNVRFRRRLT